MIFKKKKKKLFKFRPNCKNTPCGLDQLQTDPLYFQFCIIDPDLSVITKLTILCYFWTIVTNENLSLALHMTILLNIYIYIYIFEVSYYSACGQFLSITIDGK